jgi:uncharacterized protein YbjT (DUF2867 family)
LAQEGVEIHALARATSDRGGLAGVAVNWHDGDVSMPASLGNALTGAV